MNDDKPLEAPASLPAASDLIEQTTADVLKYYRELEAILDCVSVGIVVSNEGKIFLINKRAEFLLGYSRNELKGQPVEVLVPVHKRESHARDRERYETYPIPRPMAPNLAIEGARKPKGGAAEGAKVPLLIDLDSYTSSWVGLQTVATLRPKEDGDLKK